VTCRFVDRGAPLDIEQRWFYRLVYRVLDRPVLPAARVEDGGDTFDEYAVGARVVVGLS
jgi:hypothetical protein